MSLKDFTKEEAKKNIYQYYSNADKELIILLIKYWFSPTNPTQIAYREALNEILLKKENK